MTRIWYLATVDGDVLKVIASKDSRRDWPHLDTIWLSTFLVARPFARDLVVIWRAHHAPLPAR
ncbi:MAG TPA: hypothetical protein VFL91_14500 [Thermomicrobiales bacterium]|nr:hypothetical protein [Thermomicrobiales bacterium]